MAAMEGTVILTGGTAGERIDALLSRCVEGLTRSAAQRLLEEGRVTVAGKPVKKNYRPAPGEQVCLSLPEPEPAEPLPQELPLEVVYEDADLIVVNKPKGLVVHPAPGHPDGTLVNALLWHCGDSLSGVGGERRPGIVHRLDKDTSGLLAAAKNDFTHLGLSAQLSDHSMFRVYEAVARGRFREDAGKVDAPLRRDPSDRKRIAVAAGNQGRSAVTHWRVVGRYPGKQSQFTRLRCRLETGRTHQIRVHMAWIGHPLAGDSVYGGPPVKRFQGQCLHAGELEFTHPRSGERLRFHAPLPDWFREFLETLGPEETVEGVDW